jgi:hypothetical protein
MSHAAGSCLLVAAIDIDIDIDVTDDIDVRFIQFFVLLQVERSLMITVRACMHACMHAFL